MKILVAPLNWGLGHASRCVPLVRRFLAEGHEVILGGDGESLTLLAAVGAVAIILGVICAGKR